MIVVERAQQSSQARPEVETAPNAGANDPRTLIVLALIGLTAIKQLVLALAYPPFQGHDEVAHIGYLWMLVDFHRLPTFADNLPAALESYSRFTLDWPAIYTANHPPLYYVIAWPAYALAGPDFVSKLYAVRLVSIPLFLGTVWLSFRLVRALFPNDNFIVLSVPALVAFQPQLGFEGAIVNNDMLSIFLATLILYLCVISIGQGMTRRRALAIGLTLGLGLLSKATLTVFIPVVLATVVWCCWAQSSRGLRASDFWQATGARALAIGLPAVTLALPWYLYLKRTYGDLTAFKATQALQSDWNVPAGTFNQLLFSPGFHLERFRETWGYFGWKMLPAGWAELWPVYLGSFVCTVGLGLGAVRLVRIWRTGDGRGWLRSNQSRLAGISVLIGACVLLYGAMIYFGTMFMLTQARYIFPIVPAATILAAIGFRALVPNRWSSWAAATVIALAFGYQIYLMVSLVIPYAYL